MAPYVEAGLGTASDPYSQQRPRLADGSRADRQLKCRTSVSENRSTGLIEAAWTRTKTPSSGTTGVSISATFNRSADPGVSLRTALISTQFKLNGGYWSVMSVNA